MRDDVKLSALNSFPFTLHFLLIFFLFKSVTIWVFVFNTNLTFLYKIDIEGFKNFQQKITLPPVGFELTTATTTGLEFELPYPLSPPAICWIEDPYTKARSFLESIEHDCIRVLKFETGKEWQVGWVGKAVRILMWCLLLWVQIPLGGNFIFCWNFSNIWMPILYRNVRFVLKTKT